LKVVYCLASLAEICHLKRIAPFFTGDRTERQERREEWIQQQEESIPQVPNPEILEQLTSEHYAPKDDDEPVLVQVNQNNKSLGF
jgi:hypothetical protein